MFSIHRRLVPAVSARGVARPSAWAPHCSESRRAARVQKSSYGAATCRLVAPHSRPTLVCRRLTRGFGRGAWVLRAMASAQFMSRPRVTVLRRQGQLVRVRCQPHTQSLEPSVKLDRRSTSAPGRDGGGWKGATAPALASRAGRAAVFLLMEVKRNDTARPGREVHRR